MTRSGHRGRYPTGQTFSILWGRPLLEMTRCPLNARMYGLAVMPMSLT